MFQIDSTVVDPVVYLAVDCSGAGPGDVIFRRDMARIADAVRSAEIEVVVFTFDAQARFAGRYGDDTLSRLPDLVRVGGGGTMIGPVIDAIREFHGQEPFTLFVYADGLVADPDAIVPGINVVWLPQAWN